MIVNATSVVKHVIQIKNGVMKHVNVSVKIIKSVKAVIVEILVNLFVKMPNI